MKVSIGWVALDADGNPYRPTQSGGFLPRRVCPPRVYTTSERAAKYSPVGQCSEVFTETSGD